MLHSEWRVTSNYIGGEKMYSVYRLIDISETDHSGNREFAGGWVVHKQAAIDLAAELNKNTREVM